MQRIAAVVLALVSVPFTAGWLAERKRERESPVDHV
jgi:hypothetical protein